MSQQNAFKAVRYALSLAVHMAVFTAVVFSLSYIFDVELGHFPLMLLGVALGNVLWDFGAPVARKSVRRLFGNDAA